MPWHAKDKGAYDRDSAEAIDNAKMIYNILSGRYGWTAQAVSGLLGNIAAESGYNPWRWQADIIGTAAGSPWPKKGYGLVQFTPAGKYINNTDVWGYDGFNPNYIGRPGGVSDGTAQCIYIQTMPGYIRTNAYSLTFKEYQSSTRDADYLAAAWLYNYERPADPAASIAFRQDAALHWQGVLTGVTPEPGADPGETPKPPSIIPSGKGLSKFQLYAGRAVIRNILKI